MTDDEEDKNKAIRLIGVYVTIPFVLAVPPIIGWFIGDWLDRWLGTGPWLMLSLIVMGFVAGAREFYRIIREFGDKP